MDWWSAGVLCGYEYNSMMVEIKTMEQMEFLDAVLTENPVAGNKNSWLGAKDTGHDGTWKWTRTGWMVEDWIWAVGEQFMYMKNSSD